MMNIREIIKESLLHEVGEASRTPFRHKRDINSYDTRHEANKEKDTFYYNFKTKEGYTYRVDITRDMGRDPWGGMTDKDWKNELSSMYRYERSKYIHLQRIGLSKDDFRNLWGVGFSITDGPGEITTGITYDIGRGGDVDVDSERPRLIYHTPSMYDEPNKGEFYRVMSTITKIIKDHLRKHGGKGISFRPLEERRGRIFTQFILRQFPRAQYWVDGTDFYFNLNE